MKSLFAVTIAGALFCAGAAMGAGTMTGGNSTALLDNAKAAVNNPDRPATDRAHDVLRKPVDMVVFAGIKPGDKVVDFMPGAGYFTRIFSGAVGSSGKVYAFEPTEFDKFKKKDEKTVPDADPHFSNVTYIHKPIAEFATPDPVDVVWTSQNYHDLHNKSAGPADMGALNKAIFNALKPGGIYVVLDHSAPVGSGLADTNTLHRIDEAAVKKEVLAAGFVLDGESNVLRNPKDTRTEKVFAKDIRGHTDQFILKFRKPVK